jgi:E3 ubiquitin-protein ligase DOA10
MGNKISFKQSGDQVRPKKKRQLQPKPGDECRICYEDCSTERLMSSCDCIGTMQWVHLSCLRRLIYMNLSFQCPICKIEYNRYRYRTFEIETLYIDFIANQGRRIKKSQYMAAHGLVRAILNIFILAIFIIVWFLFVNVIYVFGFSVFVYTKGIETCACGCDGNLQTLVALWIDYETHLKWFPETYNFIFYSLGLCALYFL